MIPTIITLLIRRYQKKNPEKYLIMRNRVRRIFKSFFFLVAILCITTATAQEQNLSYSVKRNGSVLGSLNLKDVKSGNKRTFNLQSNLKLSFILSFIAKGVEEAIYENGILIYSFVYQTLNGSEKVNKKIKYVKNGYVISNKGSEQKLSGSIYYNLICLYTLEPVNISTLYSDKFEKFLTIQKIADHHYRIVFPDKNFNDYYYQNGICKKIVVNHSLYSAVMELKG